jgi:hypothetical protein
MNVPLVALPVNVPLTSHGTLLVAEVTALPAKIVVAVVPVFVAPAEVLVPANPVKIVASAYPVLGAWAKILPRVKEMAVVEVV